MTIMKVELFLFFCWAFVAGVDLERAFSTGHPIFYGLGVLAALIGAGYNAHVILTKIEALQGKPLGLPVIRRVK